MSFSGGKRVVFGFMGLCLLLLGVAQAGTVVVATSFPKDFTNLYKREFEKNQSQIRVEFITIPSSQILSHLRSRGAGARPDLYWTSATDSFELLVEAGLLEKTESPILSRGRFSVGDKRSRGLYHNQALSGFGIMWNRRYLAAHHLTPPADWSDLTKPEYSGHIAMSAPSRSGTVHMMIEFMLQTYGWDKGWSLIQQIAANSSLIADRSFNVVDGVNIGRYGIGLTIDFPALVSIYAGFPVGFAYPADVPLLPANIGLLKGSSNRREAIKFMEFTLSKEGQALLLTPNISRLPAVDSVYSAERLSPWLATLRFKANNNPNRYDLGLSRSRYTLVSSFFDQTITLRQKELNAAGRAIHAAEAMNRSRANSEAEGLIAEARRLAYSPVLSQAMLQDKAVLSRLNSFDLPFLEAEWSDLAKSRYVSARKLAQKAMTIMKRAKQP